ncbi:hypothetical protein BKA93DRAFT_822470 [Sparassis latifolia]
MKSLQLRMYEGSRVPSLSSLVEVARCCPLLEVLQLPPVKTDDVVELLGELPSISNPNLKELSFSGPYDEESEVEEVELRPQDPVRVTEYLLRLFPNAKLEWDGSMPGAETSSVDGTDPAPDNDSRNADSSLGNEDGDDDAYSESENGLGSETSDGRVV